MWLPSAWFSGSGGAGGAERVCAPFIFTRFARGDSSALDTEEAGDMALSMASAAPETLSGATEAAVDLGFEGPGVPMSASSSAICGSFSTKLDCGRFFFEADFCCSSARWRPLWYSRLELYVTGRGRRCLCQYFPASDTPSDLRPRART